MKTIQNIYTHVLRFDDESEFPGKFVALDRASGGYPCAVEDPLDAERWVYADVAVAYASRFRLDNSYRMYAIEPVAHVMTISVTVES